MALLTEIGLPRLVLWLVPDPETEGLLTYQRCQCDMLPQRFQVVLMVYPSLVMMDHGEYEMLVPETVSYLERARAV